MTYHFVECVVDGQFDLVFGRLPQSDELQLLVDELVERS